MKLTQPLMQTGLALALFVAGLVTSLPAAGTPSRDDERLYHRAFEVPLWAMPAADRITAILMRH